MQHSFIAFIQNLFGPIVLISCGPPSPLCLQGQQPAGACTHEQPLHIFCGLAPSIPLSSTTLRTAKSLMLHNKKSSHQDDCWPSRTWTPSWSFRPCAADPINTPLQHQSGAALLPPRNAKHCKAEVHRSSSTVLNSDRLCIMQEFTGPPWCKAVLAGLKASYRPS